MKFPIGFHAAAKHTTDHTPTPTPDPKPVTPVPSLVRVHFLTDRGRFWPEHPASPDLFVMASAEIDSFRHFNDAKSL